jgi:Domain of unknown function (DUF4399)
MPRNDAIGIKFALGDVEMKKLILVVLAAVFASACATASQPKPRVFFVEPADGATLAQEFKVVMGVEGMLVKPLGTMDPDTGHHHLIINAADIAEGEIVPVDKPDQYKHFGKGQTEISVKLAPGKYTLTLQFADGAHRSYGERMRKTISVTVQ